MRKYGTSEDQQILAEEGDLQKSASQQDRDQTLAEVKTEAQQQDEE